MPSANLVNSPAILPIPRHPSPLSFSVSAQDAPSPPSPRFPQPASMTSKSLTNGNILVTGPSRSPDITPTRGLPPASPSPPSPSRVETLVPTHPQPDSLLCRSTFAALEHSSTTLKRLSKSVLASTTVYLTLLEHLERSEDDLMANLGELGRWLEGGYGLNGAVWEPEGGIRKMRKQRWRKEREEMEVMVEQGLKAVKADIKRNGLAGGEAHAKFENTAKQFYHQTSQYLSPQPSSLTSTFGPGPPIPSTHALNTSQPSASSSSSQLPAVTSRTPQTGQAVSSDLAQAARLAQFDLERYSHHSTLLYAVPPSSISCLDLLMGLYTWAGGLLSETPGRLQGAGGSERELVTSLTSSSRYQEFTPLHSPARLPSNISSKDSLKSSLFDSQAHLGQMRSDLLYAWAMRNRYTTTLEETASLRQSELDGSALTSPVGQSEWAVTSISSNGIEHRNDRKMHKIHRSVGGRLRDLLSSSGSSTSLTGIAAGDKGSRTTLNGMYGRTGNGTETLPEDDILITSPLPTSPSDDDTTTRTFPFPASTPPPPPNGVSSRPTLPSPHSVHIPREPFLPLPFDSSPDLRSAPARFGGVGGLNGTGDEDDKREEVGRKKEGVLWGAGNWAAVNKAGGRGKWEKFWVVLDRSKIYEYRDNGLGRPESAHAVVDLKFASVREGRGTDRRFVFELVTPTQGRRQYQATSDSEMKQWLYAICNAIESCINGISSVRTFDASKLRTVSGSLDDHALPNSSKLVFPLNGGVVGLGLPMAQMLASPSSRQSMPPHPRFDMDGLEKSQRKTSFKKVLKQSGEKLSSVVSGQRYSVEAQRPPFLAQVGRMGSKRSRSSGEEVRPTPLTSTTEASPSSTRSRPSDKTSWHAPHVDEDIEKRVHEMAGLGLGVAPSPSSTDPQRVHNEGVAKLSPGAIMTRSRSAEDDKSVPEEAEIPDMRMLRRIADLPSNNRCADCGKGMKSSRWATLSLHEVPMVLFICIRCCGLHRGLSTHVSKPRSVDLDIWSPDSILLARKWGNEKANAIWERRKPASTEPSDDAMKEYIQAKYVEGRWLGEEDRRVFGLGTSDEAGIPV